MDRISELVERYPLLKGCEKSILEAYKVLEKCFASGSKLLIAGNGGSCADAEHIVGELMKGFKNCRVCDSKYKAQLEKVDAVRGKELANKLQAGLPAINLANHHALNSAFINDVENGGVLTYAQQVNVLGNKGDVLLAISTSGNAKNVAYASVVAKAKGMKVVGLSGKDGGYLKENADVCIVVPEKETYKIQEYHLPIYHTLCLMLEEHFFK